MKILYLYQHFVLPEKSGITRTFEFARRLVAMGHEIHLIASDEDLNSRHSKPYIQIVNGIHIHLLPIPYHNSMGFFKRVMAFMKYICGAIRCGVHLDYDLVYASSPPLTTTLSAIFLARIKKIPLVLEVRDLWPDLPIAFGVLRDPFSIILTKAIERLAYHSSAHVIALSPGIKRAITARGVKSENISFIPNSSDIESFRLGKDRKPSLPKGIDKEDLIVLYTGTLGIANGVSYICSLAKETIHSHPHIKFVVIGDGKEKGLILDLAAQIRRYRGWEASGQDEADIALLYKDLKSLKQRKHRMRVSFVIAIGKGKASKTYKQNRKGNHVVRFAMAGCHVYISAYRILSDGSMSERGVILQSPYRETFLNVA